MLKKVLNVIVIVLATLGVLFIILMLIPDNDKEDAEAEAKETVESVEESADREDEEEAEEEKETENSAEDNDAFDNTESIASVFGTAEGVEEASSEEKEDSGNTVNVNIPESEISNYAMKFRSTTLDNKKVSQDIFSDYDISVVYVWATYCEPCKKQMDKYAAMYDDLPDNVNLVGLITDVYDGLDTNVQDANDIMNGVGAGFTNIRASDDLYEVLANIQYTPSSFFVDREGHIVGGLLEGAGCDDTKKELEKFLD